MQAADCSTVAAADDGVWSRHARDHFHVHVSWRIHDGGKAVHGHVRDRRFGDSQPFALRVAPPEQPIDRLMLTLTGQDKGSPVAIDVTLTLESGAGRAALRCNLPLDSNEFYDDAIADWPLGPQPLPDCPDGDDAMSCIEPAGEPSDAAPFIWMRPQDRSEQADSALRFVLCDIPQVRHYFAGLDAGPKQQKASSYMDSADFVANIGDLGPVIGAFPTGRELLLLELEDSVPLAQQLTIAEAQLHIWSLTEFLFGEVWQQARARAWMSLCALALVGRPSQAALWQELSEVLSVGHYLDLLWLGDPALVQAYPRSLALAARPALPDDTAATPLAPGASGRPWQVLGIGDVRMARQQAEGYLPGELADVVNVMPRSRQQLRERTVSSAAGRDEQHDEQVSTSDTGSGMSVAVELADMLRQVAAADGAAFDLSNATCSYQNLAPVEAGSGSRGKARAGWAGADTSRLVRRLTEQAASRLGESVGRQRVREWREWRERRQTESIDNGGDSRLVGVYRWVDRIIRMRTEDLGPRLVVGFVVAHPAQGWLAALAAQGPAPLAPPAPLPAGYADITPDNYQTLGAELGLAALAPPPADLIQLSTSVDQAVPLAAASLRVPPGYAATSAVVTVALSDNTCNLVASVGGSDLPALSAGGSVPALSVAVPACAGTSAGPVTVALPAPPVAVLCTSTLASLAVTTGDIPVLVMCAAPRFAVTVSITCQRVAGTGADPLLTAWQVDTFRQLRAAHQQAQACYEDALHRRIGEASHGRTGALQAAILRDACTGLLAPEGTATCPLEGLFDWAQMTWHYATPTTVARHDWPHGDGGESTRPASAGLFRQFLAAQQASVLVPVRLDAAAELLFRLQFGRPWDGPAARTPVTEGTLALLETLRDAAGRETAQCAPEYWSIRIPTAMMYLQDGAQLPATAALKSRGESDHA